MHDRPPNLERDDSGVTPPSATGRGGFSATRVARMHAALGRHVDSAVLPGLVALVSHRGREHLEVIGAEAFGSSAPIRRESIFRLASMTKPITAVGAMILVEECRIRLDDAVEEWLPELRDRRVLRTIESPLDDTVPARRPITLRDLLTLRSGYGEPGFLSPTCPLQQAMSQARVSLAEWPFTMTPEEFMQRIGSLPLAHQPGERWLYHTSAEILGVLIARVAGQSLSGFLRERIFEPLEMKDTGFHVPASALDRLPACYGRDFVTGEVAVLHEARDGHFGRPPVFESGGGGLVSTADDLLAFGRMMMNRGIHNGRRILSRPSVELMTMDHITVAQKALSPFFEDYWENHGWGLGLGVITGRGALFEVPGRFGWEGAFGTSWWVDPREQLVGVFLTQRRPDSLCIPAFIQDFWTSAYQLIDD